MSVESPVDSWEERYRRWRAAPVFSCCSAGPGRWFWVVYRTHDEVFEGSPPLFTGVSVSREAAAQAIEVAYGSFTEWDRNLYAASLHRAQAVEKRRQRRSPVTESAPVEFVYNWHECDQGPGSWYKYRIVKKTAKRVFVEDRVYREPGYNGAINTGGFSLTDPYDMRTFVLDRAELEREGSARRSGGWWMGTYYLKPDPHRGSRSVPACLERLGLALPVTVTAVKSAYRRLSRTLHPDQGGDPEAFILLQQAYEDALALCNGSKA